MCDSCRRAGVVHAVSTIQPIEIFLGSARSVSCGIFFVRPGQTIFAAPSLYSKPPRFTRPTSTFVGGEPITFHIVYLCMKIYNKAYNGRVLKMKTK
jgi:hypothetical protein